MAHHNRKSHPERKLSLRNAVVAVDNIHTKTDAQHAQHIKKNAISAEKWNTSDQYVVARNEQENRKKCNENCNEK